MVVIKSDRDGRGPTRVICQTPPHSSRPLPFNWENMESVLAVKILEQKHQPCPPPPLPPLPRKVTSDTLVSTRDKTLVPSSCCYSRPQLADETRVRIIPTFSGQFKPRMVQHVIHDMPSPARRSTLIQRWTTVKHRLAILLLQKSKSKCYRKSQNWGYIMIDKGPEIYYQVPQFFGIDYGHDYVRYLTPNFKVKFSRRDWLMFHLIYSKMNAVRFI